MEAHFPLCQEWGSAWAWNRQCFAILRKATLLTKTIATALCNERCHSGPLCSITQWPWVLISDSAGTITRGPQNSYLAACGLHREWHPLRRLPCGPCRQWFWAKCCNTESSGQVTWNLPDILGAPNSLFKKSPPAPAPTWGATVKHKLWGWRDLCFCRKQQGDGIQLPGSTPSRTLTLLRPLRVGAPTYLQAFKDTYKIK